MTQATARTQVEAGSARHATHYERVYVWQFPIRAYHWVNALSLVVLFVTGLFIAHPVLTGTGEAWQVFVMARFRQVHFAAGFVFLICFLWRVYWFFMGNRYARSGFPAVWRGSWWRNLVRQAFDYLKLDFGHVHLGHNALAGLSYAIFAFGLTLAQILTGFALYGQTNPGGIVDRWCGWVIPLLGGSFRTHMWHNMFSWGFLLFVILHVYIVLLDARQYRNGLLVSMITGFKFRRAKDQHDES